MLESLFYVKEALGINGRPIRVYKFRTMEIRADDRLEEALDGGLNHYGKPNRDERITRIGRFLRRYWLDEIPQLYNLARGDLKLVGIRPSPERWWGLFPFGLKEKALNKKPGLVGFQYAYRSGDGFETYVKRMEQYIEEEKAAPVLTGIKYFFRTLSNIAFRGVRGE